MTLLVLINQRQVLQAGHWGPTAAPGRRRLQDYEPFPTDEVQGPAGYLEGNLSLFCFLLQAPRIWDSSI